MNPNYHIDDKVINSFKEHKKFFIIIFVILIILGFIFLGFLGGLSVLFGGVVFYISMKVTILHRKFMKDFAEKNNMLFEENFHPNNLEGRLFGISPIEHTSNCLSGSYQNFDFKIFNYSYTVGSGKNSKTYPFTVCEIKIPETELPYMLLLSKTMWRYDNRDFFTNNKETKINLEDNYKKYYSLYTKEDYEIETLQIFSKDILDFLISEGSHFSIELSKNSIYIYDDKIIRTEKDLDVLFDLSKKMIEKIGPLLIRMKSAFDSMHEYYSKDI